MLIVFFGFAAFVVASVPMVSSAPGGPLTVFLALGAMYVACAVLLARSAAIRAFLQRPMPGVPSTQAPPP